MKFGIRKPSIRRSLAARTSVKRALRHRAGLKMPRSGGWITDPKKAAYNAVYSRTTVSIWSILRAVFKAVSGAR